MKSLRFAMPAVLAAGLLVVGFSSGGAQAAVPDHYKCYKLKGTKKKCLLDPTMKCKVDADCPGVGNMCLQKFPKGLQVTLTDQFETNRVYDVKKPKSICTPVDKNGEGILDPTVHMKRYQIKLAKVPRQDKTQKTLVLTEDQYGQHVLMILKEESLLAPTGKSLGGPADVPTTDHDHYKCYKVKDVKKKCTGDLTTKCKKDADCATAGGTCYLGFPKGVQATLTDQFEVNRVYDVKKIKLLCTPADKNGGGIVNDVDHLTGYQIKLAKNPPQQKSQKIFPVWLNNSNFGPEVITTIKEEFLLVPTIKNPPVCPQPAGEVTLTQVAGGTLQVDGLPPFPFPAGGTIVQDVSAGDANCVHDVVVPFPGGFSAPVFCVPALGFTVALAQTGCGIGLMDSDGGSDFTVAEVGDTSSPSICGLPHVGCAAGADSSVQVDVTVGDGAADACAPGTAGQALVTIPVHTITWLEVNSGSSCPANDGTFDPGLGDLLIVEFDQNLDFTTDTNSADWADLDPDSCCLAGAGPGSVVNPCAGGGPGPLVSTGTCIDNTFSTVTTAASGPIGSSGAPLFDLTFTTVLPNTITQSGPFQGLTCSPAPVIDLSARGAPGSVNVTRCIP